MSVLVFTLSVSQFKHNFQNVIDPEGDAVTKKRWLTNQDQADPQVDFLFRKHSIFPFNWATWRIKR